jgi:hypothetical protein
MAEVGVFGNPVVMMPNSKPTQLHHCIIAADHIDRLG